MSTLVSGNCVLEAQTERTILPLLDGTRDHSTLAHELGTSPDAVQRVLLALARNGLLSG